MKENQRLKRRFQERQVWTWLKFVSLGIGIILCIPEFFLIFFLPSYLSKYFDLLEPPLYIGVWAIISSAFFELLSHLGWSKSIFIDFLFNRFSSILIVIGLVLSILSPPFSTKIFPPPYSTLFLDTGNNYCFLAIGCILFLVGVILSKKNEQY